MVLECTFMGIETFTTKDLVLENGVEYKDISECLSTCTDSKSCHSITYCDSNKGISVCYLQGKNVSIEVEEFDLNNVNCKDGYCAHFINCTTLKKICPRGS